MKRLRSPMDVGPSTAVIDIRGGQDGASAVVATPDGGFVVAGSTNRPAPENSGKFALVRYAASGEIDPAFGQGGTVTTGFGSGYAGADGLAVQPDGRIVAVGVFNAPDGGIALPTVPAGAGS